MRGQQWTGGNGDEGGHDADADAREGEEAEDATAAATPGEVLAPVPALDGPVPSELRHWIRRLDAGGAFEAYAAAFEQEFRTLEDLALAADDSDVGLAAVFDKCGVQRLGDRARLKFAINKLPRPE